MTIREYLHRYLCDSGLWLDEATAVLIAMEGREESMRGRWDEDTSAYLPQLLGTLTLRVRREAVGWLKANKPMHFALPILEDHS